MDNPRTKSFRYFINSPDLRNILPDPFFPFVAADTILFRIFVIQSYEKSVIYWK